MVRRHQFSILSQGGGSGRSGRDGLLKTHAPIFRPSQLISRIHQFNKNCRSAGGDGPVVRGGGRSLFFFITLEPKVE